MSGLKPSHCLLWQCLFTFVDPRAITFFRAPSPHPPLSSQKSIQQNHQLSETFEAARSIVTFVQFV